jgi:hypothetical protein
MLPMHEQQEIKRKEELESLKEELQKEFEIQK